MTETKTAAIAQAIAQAIAEVKDPRVNDDNRVTYANVVEQIAIDCQVLASPLADVRIYERDIPAFERAISDAVAAEHRQAGGPDWDSLLNRYRQTGRYRARRPMV